jgi:ubiquinol-cytochrome c reductase cytochrome b subunit
VKLRLPEHGMSRSLWGLLRSPVPPAERTDLLLALVILFLFLLQVATGILLAFFYQPSPVTVADSVQLIMRDVDWGWVVRGLHHWSAQAILPLCAFQVARILWRGTYRGQGSSSWSLGLLMLLCATLLAYTGELLVWDQAAYWRITSALEQVESAPLIGNWIAHVLRGGDEVSATTLSRVFSVHSLLLPWVLGALAVFEGWFFALRLRGSKGRRA